MLRHAKRRALLWYEALSDECMRPSLADAIRHGKRSERHGKRSESELRGSAFVH